MQRRRFTVEFKAEAVRQALQPGVSKAKVAADLQIHDNVLRKWVRQAQGSAASSRAPKADESLTHLAREN
jgi:transposase